MKILVILVITTTVILCKSVEKHQKNVVNINGKLHKTKIIANGIDRPYQLSYCRHQHKLYFSYNVGHDNEDKFQVGYMKMDQRWPTPIEAVENGFATAIDEDNNLVFFGGSNGIYQESLENPGNVTHVVKSHNIWDLFYKDHLYFINYPAQRLYMKWQNTTALIAEVHEKIYGFAIDKDNDTFIYTANGIYGIKSGSTDRSFYSGPTVFRAISVDRKGVAHFCGQNGIYIANKQNHTLEEIACIKNIFGLTFDHDNNMIYSNPHAIIRILP